MSPWFSPGRARRAPRPAVHRRTPREWLALYRRPLAACCAALSVAACLAVLAPERAPTRSVVVAAADLPAGSLLAAGDLEVARVPAAALPRDTFAAPSEVAGRQLAVPVAAGSPVYGAGLVGPGLLTGTDPGTVAVPVRPSDAQAVSLLSPGQLVDVVLSEGNGYETPFDARRIARSLPVLWVPSEPGRGGWLGGADTPGVVVLAASADEAEALAGAAGRGRLSLVLVGAA